MKLLRLFSLVFLVLVGLVTKTFAMTQNEVNVFLQEFIDGKPTGQTIHFDFIIYSMSEKDENKWLLTEETFATLGDQKYTTVNLTQTRSNDDYRTPYIHNVKWLPGKKIECTYEPYDGGMSVEMKAIKGPGNKYDWNVYCVGSYKLTGNDSVHKWEFKSVKEETLKFNKLKFQAIYYRKDEPLPK